MKNIMTICRNDLRRIGASVVAIVIILGLCAVPCLYAWFNIFSNWDPYGPDATSRIRVAVASEDEGAEVLGLKLNVGSQVISALEANSDIGWVFASDSDEALKLVHSSDCYAALVIPEDFTEDVISFLSGKISNPQLVYWQNDKMNAIAPKITGKAKTAVQGQVNATFVQTITGDIASLISVANANGISCDSLLDKLSGDVNALGDKLSDCCTALDAANGLTNAARNLISVSINLCSDAGTSLSESQNVLNKTVSETANVDERIDSTAAAVTAAIKQTDANLAEISGRLSSIFSDVNKYNDYVSKGLAADITLLNSMASNCRDMANAFNEIGLDSAAAQMNSLADRLSSLSAKLAALETANEESWEGIRAQQDGIISEISECRSLLTGLQQSVGSDLAPRLHAVINSTQGAAASVNSVLGSLSRSTNALSGTLGGYLGSIGTLQGGFAQTKNALTNAQDELRIISELIISLKNSQMLEQISDALENNGDRIGAYLASPIEMETVIQYEVENYGSAMAPFYTVLAQWVGALLCATLLKVKLRAEDVPAGLKIHERFFGRYALFFLVAIAQALIVSLGDIWYVHIQCISPWRFVLAAVVVGLCFSLINYALVFALDNIGMGISVIVMVVQVAGAGGTYPVEVLPEIFRKLYNYMPFKYAMDSMRETVAGMYEGAYAHNILILLCIAIGAIAFGIALYYPCLKLNTLIDSSKKRSEIML